MKNKNNIKLLNRKTLKPNLNIDIEDSFFKTNITFIQKSLINDAYSNKNFHYNKTFELFKSINDIIYIVYTNKINSIILYNIINNKKIYEIKNPHKNPIICFRYHLDNIKKRDLILSISFYQIKLWNINNTECLFNITKNNDDFYYSAGFLNDNKNIYLIISNYNENNFYNKQIPESFKVYDVNGYKIQRFEKFKENAKIIEHFYDDKSFKNFIIISNNLSIKSYDFDEDKMCNTFEKSNNIMDIIISKKDNKNILIGIKIFNNEINIWDIYSGKLLKLYKDYGIMSPSYLSCICLWNEEKLFFGTKVHKEFKLNGNGNSDYYIIKLINLKDGSIMDNITILKQEIITIKKIIHPKYDECLIFQDLNGEINLLKIQLITK